MSFTRFTRLALILAGLGIAASASAQIKTWNFTDSANPGLCNLASGSGTSIGGAVSCADQSTSGPPFNLAITGFSASNGGSTTGTTNNTVAGTGTNTFSASSILNHGGTAPDGLGLGVGGANAPESGATTTSTRGNHAMDSNDGYTDMMLLSYTSAQVLRTVTLGWASPDGDFQVLACTNATYCGAAPTITGKKASDLLANAVGGGWSLITTVNAPAVGVDATFNVNAGLVSSSYWLITAFNSSFGGSVGNTVGDAIKIMGVTAGISVPEPGSLALAGLALFGVVASRRRAVEAA